MGTNYIMNLELLKEEKQDCGLRVARFAVADLGTGDASSLQPISPSHFLLFLSFSFLFSASQLLSFFSSTSQLAAA
jgi:hypothetical protein